MDMLSASYASMAASLQQTLSLSMADMVTNGSLSQMSASVEQVSQTYTAPPTDGVGVNLDARA